jgi:hypothetical protein
MVGGPSLLEDSVVWHEKREVSEQLDNGQWPKATPLWPLDSSCAAEHMG